MELEDDMADLVMTSLVEIWQRALSITDVPVDANFFELGGRSATLVRVALEIEDRYGIEMSLRDFFETPTVRGLTMVVAEALARKAADA